MSSKTFNEFSKKYKNGQKVYLVIPGEGVYNVTVKKYDTLYNRYNTDTWWYILPKTIVFETEEQLKEYKKTNQIYVKKGCSEWGYSSYSEWVY